ncbi:MAG TPA: hypothetical protein VNN20_12435 [Thermodesulfobacteriota bacterium]|nr:hypothetical protein [Thermodesulfobacteriota bacterium]
MISSMNYRQNIIAVLVGVALGVMMLATTACDNASGKQSVEVFPPNSNPFGKKYSEWSTEWWQYVLSIPPSENPLLDETGEKCVVGQHGPVWFLAGTFFGGETMRACSIPEGTALFFPVINSAFIDTPNVCGQGPERTPLDEMRALTAEFIDGATNLLVEVDGNPIPSLGKRFRIKSEVFNVALPEDNLFDPFCEDFGGVPAGIYSPSVDDGFYVMLKPLDAGEHTLRIHAENPDQDFFLDVTYNLTVVPVELE